MFLSADKSLRPTLVRMAVIIIAFLLALILLITNLVNKQIINAEFYRQKAVAQYTTETSINPRRGTIYDRNMNQLAVSVSVENVFISPNEIEKENEEKIADYLSELLGADREELLRRMDNKKNKYYVVKKQVERDVTDEIRT